MTDSRHAECTLKKNIAIYNGLYRRILLGGGLKRVKLRKKSIPVEKSTPDGPRDRSDGSRHVLRDVSRGIDSR